MINIYSIKEIIDASNNILNRTEPKNKVPYSEKSNPKKNTFLKKDQPLILKKFQNSFFLSPPPLQNKVDFLQFYGVNVIFFVICFLDAL